MGVDDRDLWGGDVWLAWFQRFWDVLREGWNVGVALASAVDAVLDLELEPPEGASDAWNTDFITSTDDEHKIVRARYE